MDGLLTPVSISYKTSGLKEEDALVETRPPPPEAISKPSFQASTPNEALDILRSEPDFESLALTLRYLCGNESTFDIRSPNPLAAQLVRVLVSYVVPNYWTVLQGQQDVKKSRRQKKESSRRKSELELVLRCLRSVTGLNAILLRLKEFIQLSKETRKAIGGPNVPENLKILLQVLTELVKEEDTVEDIWNSISNTSDSLGKQKALWNEALVLMGSGKILGVSAEAEDIIIENNKDVDRRSWLADGILYSSWLGRNITHWANALPSDSENGWRSCSELLGKAFRLGYTGKKEYLNGLKLTANGFVENVLKEVLTSLLLRSSDSSTIFLRLIDGLPDFEQRNVLYTVLKIISKDYLSVTVTSNGDSRWWQSDATVVSAAAGLIKKIIANEEIRKTQLITWLTGSSGAGVGDGIPIRRAAITAISGDKNNLETVLEKSLQQFGDQLYIRHTPILQQEGTILKYTIISNLGLT